LEDISKRILRSHRRGVHHTIVSGKDFSCRTSAQPRKLLAYLERVPAINSRTLSQNDRDDRDIMIALIKAACSRKSRVLMWRKEPGQLISGPVTEHFFDRQRDFAPRQSVCAQSSSAKTNFLARLTSSPALPQSAEDLHDIRDRTVAGQHRFPFQTTCLKLSRCEGCGVARGIQAATTTPSSR